ncbi:hypothetical protein KSX_14470 [Ktedonospora formicarum]|uniref:Uncharacterized protein n=2 Tax=Ktedonospora formicarum TaxID=2778364 RepID=A0A8J3I1N9_9CHLR|nr:hypothetical protein KSX_14470 [Ktedonospora formicarum]
MPKDMQQQKVIEADMAREVEDVDDPDQAKTEKFVAVKGRKETLHSDDVLQSKEVVQQKEAKASKLAPIPQVPATPAPTVKGRRALARLNEELANLHALKERCRQMCLSIFFRRDTTINSIGFTSSIPGEGKSFLASIAALSLSQDSSVPVTLIECNWEHPSLHEVFGCDATPGLAEWLRGECGDNDMRRQIAQNLTVIPAGSGKQDAVRLLQQMRGDGLKNLLSPRHEQLLLVDLPPVVTAGYGSLAATLVDTLIVVVRAGVTTDRMIAETCEQLKDLPLQGIIMNQMQSKIPNWIRQLL